MPKVSVIIPVYNSEKYIRICLDSVINQTLDDIEIICIDDGSSDNSYNILKEYAAKDNRFILLRQNNSGPSVARNFGWSIAKSDIIAFLDADDVWHRQKLELQYTYMVLNEDIFFSCHKKMVIKITDVNQFNESNKKINHVVKMNVNRLLFKHYTNGATSSFMLRNNSNIRFDIKKRRSEDYLFTLQVLFHYKGVYLDSQLAASFKEIYGAGGLSKDLWAMEKGDLNTFEILRKERYINNWFYIAAVSFSFLKYIRRSFILLIRR